MDERTARIRMKKEYDDISKQFQSIERMEAHAQNIGSETKYGRQSSNFQTSPLRKVNPAKKVDSQSLVIEFDDSIIDEEQHNKQRNWKQTPTLYIKQKPNYSKRTVMVSEATPSNYKF